eukprot:284814954_6
MSVCGTLTHLSPWDESNTRRTFKMLVLSCNQFVNICEIRLVESFKSPVLGRYHLLSLPPGHLVSPPVFQPIMLCKNPPLPPNGLFPVKTEPAMSLFGTQ